MLSIVAYPFLDNPILSQLAVVFFPMIVAKLSPCWEQTVGEQTAPIYSHLYDQAITIIKLPNTPDRTGKCAI